MNFNLEKSSLIKNIFIDPDSELKFVLCSDDNTSMLLFNSCMRSLGAKYGSSIIFTNYKDLDSYVEAIDDMSKFVFLIEKRIDNYHVEDMTKNFASICTAKVILLSGEFSPEEVFYYYEYGTRSLITKPISLQKMIEKVSNILRPNKELGKAVEDCKIAIQRNEITRACFLIEKIFLLYPNSTRGYLLQGMLFEKQNNLVAAEQSYLSAHQTEELFVEPIKKLISLYNKTSNKSEELKYLNKILSASPSSFQTRLMALNYYIENKISKFVQDEIKQIFDISLNKTSVANAEKLSQVVSIVDSEYHLFLIRVLEIRCQNIINKKYIHPLNYCFFIELIKKHLSKGNYPSALKYSSVLPAKSLTLEGLFLNAVCLFYTSQYKDSLSLLKKISADNVACEPYSAICKCFMACCHIMLKEAEHAKRIVIAALKDHPNILFFSEIERLLTVNDTNSKSIEVRVLKTIGYEQVLKGFVTSVI